MPLILFIYRMLKRLSHVQLSDVLFLKMLQILMVDYI